MNVGTGRAAPSRAVGRAAGPRLGGRAAPGVNGYAVNGRAGPPRLTPRVGAAPATHARPTWNHRGRRRRAMPLWQELPILLIVAFCLAVLIRTFLLQAFFIPSGSMETTLLIGDRVLVNKVVYDVREPQRGEVVVFRGTDAWAPENQSVAAEGVVARVGRTLGDLVGISQPGAKDFIKRVIGRPGDRVSCCDGNGNVLVNGKPLDEREYLPEERNSPAGSPPTPGQCGPRAFAEVVVGPGEIFVMGDHRKVSQDSRCQGTVPIENVIGRAFVIVWPNERWDGLPVPASFDKVPKGTALPAQPAPGPASPGLRSEATREGDATKGAGARASGASANMTVPARPRDTGAGWALVLPILACLAAPASSRRCLSRTQRRLLE